MRTVLVFALATSSLLACSGEPGSGLDGEWEPTPAADSGKTSNDGGDSGSVQGAIDSGAANDAAQSSVDSGTTKDAATTIDAGVVCLKGVNSPASGKHHAGADCMSCHDGLSANLKWTVAGTLYTNAAGAAAISGANIEIIDAQNKKVVLATTDNGNFYTTQAFAFPVKVRASKCPDDAKMVASATGSCNSNSCHVSGKRIHLP